MAEIWKDYFFDLGDVDQTEVTITVSDIGGGNPVEVYSGRAVRRPGDATLRIRANDIIAQYLGQSLPSLVDSGYTPAPSIRKAVKVASTEKTLSTNFEYSYLYRDFDFAELAGLSLPVTGEVHPDQYLIITRQAAESVEFRLTFRDGTQGTVIIPVAISADFNDDYNEDYSTSEAGGPADVNAVLYLGQFPNLARVEVIGESQTLTFNVVDDCSRYVLYYVNPVGGWDSLMVKGEARQTDSYSRTSYQKEYDNSVPYSRGETPFLNEITQAYELHTGYLLGDAGERMGYLLGSNDVYLYDTVEKRMDSVVITDTSCQYLNYRKNGNKLVEYTINVKLAQERIRR